MIQKYTLTKAQRPLAMLGILALTGATAAYAGVSLAAWLIFTVPFLVVNWFGAK